LTAIAAANAMSESPTSLDSDKLGKSFGLNECF
jgi:hypothetical protein